MKNPSSLKLEDTIFQDPEFLKTITQTGIKWFEERDFEKAYLYFSFLALVASQNTSFWILKGITEENLGKQKDALKTYLSVLVLEPENLLAQVSVIRSLIVLGQTELARQALEKFSKIDPSIYANDEDIVSQLVLVKKALKAA